MMPTILEPLLWIALLVGVLVYLYFWDVVLHGQAYWAGRTAMKTREKEFYRGGIV